jgi:hypothetical protein
MEKIIIVFKHMQQENQSPHESIVHLQVFKHQHHWGVFLQHYPKQKNHVLPCKFDETHLKI